MNRQIQRPGSLAERPTNFRPSSRASVRSAAVVTDIKKKGTGEPELESWLKRKGLPEQKVKLAYYDSAGRGLQAIKKIGKGEALLGVPESALLTAERAADCISIKDTSGTLPSWSLLAVALCEARFGSGNAWSEYAQALPTSSGSVLEWSKDEVLMLQGSTAAASAATIQQAAEASLQELGPLIEKAERDGNVSKGSLSRERLLWAFSMLLSRLVRLPALGNIEALCPWADMINHDCKGTATLDFDRSKRCATLISDRKYSSGEQVLASYGPKSSADLLLSYGFCPEQGENPHDACPVILRVSEEDSQGQDKLAVLQEYGLGATQSFPLKVDRWPSGVVQYAAFLESEVESTSELGELGQWLFGKSKFPLVDGVDTELLGLEILKDTCKERLKGYPESMDDNREKIKAFRSDPMRQREVAIRQIKLNEQRVLQRTTFLLQQKLDSISKF